MFPTDPFPILETERLVLREMTISDAEVFFNLRSNEEVMQFLDRPLAVTIEDAINLIEKRKEIELAQTGLGWAICLQSNGEVIGDMGFYRVDVNNQKTEIGYILNPGYWRKGYASEAMDAVLKFGFEILNFNKIEADINPENKSSINLVTKMGFKMEAHLRQNLLFNGRFIDSLVFGLLANEWMAISNK
jgi:ribosomal-protein-alanine N-acetyltransferase